MIFTNKTEERSDANMVDILLLKDTIEDRGITIVKLSEKTGIDRATLYNRFNGKGEFTASEIVSMTDALRLTPKERDSIFLLENVN